MAKGLADEPEAVTVVLVSGEGGSIYRIVAAPNDVEEAVFRNVNYDSLTITRLWDVTYESGNRTSMMLIALKEPSNFRSDIFHTRSKNPDTQSNI
jgi:hypothetical protein